MVESKLTRYRPMDLGYADGPQWVYLSEDVDAELAQLRTERDRLKKALEEIRYTSIHYTQDGDEVHDIVDAALTQREGGEA